MRYLELYFKTKIVYKALAKAEIYCVKSTISCISKSSEKLSHVSNKSKKKQVSGMAMGRFPILDVHMVYMICLYLRVISLLFLCLGKRSQLEMPF